MSVPPGGSEPDQQQSPWLPHNSPPHPYPALPAPPVFPPGHAPGGHGLPGVFGVRIVQYLLDVLLSFILMAITMTAVGYLALTFKDAGIGLAGVLIPVYLVGFASIWFVLAWWPSTHGGQTPAMKWLKLRIVTTQGGKPTLGALTIRWLLLLLIDNQIFGVVGLIALSSSAGHQRVGDKAAKTLVVRTH
jgi:uncharacterized RDD family membrane protein YckC